MCSTKQRLAAVLREQRGARGWTLREAAHRASLAPSTLSRWEAGTCVPRVPELESLLTSLGTGRRDIVRILSSLDAPRAARAAKARSQGRTSVGLPPSGGALLRLLRHRAGYTISFVADQLGVNPSTVSRWEASLSHPAPDKWETLMNLLQATPDERECLDTSGVAKIKSDRRPFDSQAYSIELDRLEQQIAEGLRDRSELRLLQLQSNLWWWQGEPGAEKLADRAQIILCELLLADERYADAELLAESILSACDRPYDYIGVRALCVVASLDVRRSGPDKPHFGLLMLQRCLYNVADEPSRACILTQMAELSLLAGRIAEASRYASRATSSARLCTNAGLVARAERVRKSITATEISGASA